MTTFLKVVKNVTAHKFQNIYMNINLFFKSCTLLHDEVPGGPKYVAVIDDTIKRLLCFTVIYIYTHIYIYKIYINCPCTFYFLLSTISV